MAISTPAAASRQPTGSANISTPVIIINEENRVLVEQTDLNGGFRFYNVAPGSYRLRVPYADERELLMDILRHGRHVEVEGPDSLRRLVTDEVAALKDIYRA